MSHYIPFVVCRLFLDVLLRESFQIAFIGILLLFLGAIGAEIQQFNHWPVGVNRAVWVDVQ